MSRKSRVPAHPPFLRAALLAALVLPWFYACPPSDPLLIPPQPVPQEAEPAPLPPLDQPLEELPTPDAEGGRASAETSLPAEYESLLLLTVPGNEAWTDTGVDVDEGRRLYIQAEGAISLQKGNPTAVCGPEGYNLRTVQQPLPDRNIGALIGKVVLLLSVSTDPQTGKEVRDELVQFFPVGGAGEVTIPLRGRLYLGVNELVVGDNEGAFKVRLYVLR